MKPSNPRKKMIITRIRGITLQVTSSQALWLGLAPGSKSRAIAAEAGLEVMDVAEAVKAADVIMIAVPDTVQKALYDAEIGPNLRDGQLLMFAHGFNIRFGRIVPPASAAWSAMISRGPRSAPSSPNHKRAWGRSSMSP